MNHVIGIHDLGPSGVRQVLDQAADWKAQSPGEHLKGAVLGMVFFNPSLRTRTSFELAMLRGGGHAIVLEVGAGTWKLESREGVIMDGDKTEHLKEAIPVLCRYVDLLAVRSFSNGTDEDLDHTEPVLEAIRRYATVPVISMEGAREHPCQGLADLLTMRENFGDLKGLPVTLTWAPHIKPLPKAVPNSFLLSAITAGCQVRLAHPPGFELHESVLAQAAALAAETGATLETTQDQAAALAGSAVIYPKAWGPTVAGAELSQASWCPTIAHLNGMRADAILMHCLPVRRDLEVSSELLDSPHSRVVDEAENRFHVQRVLLDRAYHKKENSL